MMRRVFLFCWIVVCISMFTDHYIKEVEKYGKKANVWGALTHAKGSTSVKVENVLMDCWYNGFADPKEMIRLGYNVISAPDGLVYIVPAAGYYHDYLNCKYLYEKWTPAMIGNQQFDEGHPQIRGVERSLWQWSFGKGYPSSCVASYADAISEVMEGERAEFII